MGAEKEAVRLTPLAGVPGTRNARAGRASAEEYAPAPPFPSPRG